MACALLAAVGSAQARVVASVNGVDVDSSQVDKFVLLMKKVFPGALDQNAKELNDIALNEIMTNIVFTDLAKKQGIDQSEDYKSKIQEFEANAKRKELDKDPLYKDLLDVTKANLLKDLYYKSLYDGVKPDEDAVRKLYDGFKERYENSRNYQVEEIVVENVFKADEVYRELAKGTPFKELIGKYSINPKAAANNENMVRIVNDADIKERSLAMYELVKGIPDGKWNTKPFKSGRYYHILHVVKSEDMPIPTFEQMRPKFEHEIKKDEADKIVANITKQSVVVIKGDGKKQTSSSLSNQVGNAGHKDASKAADADKKDMLPDSPQAATAP